MSRLILRFHDKQFDEFDWTTVDADAVAVDISWQQSKNSELGRLLSQHPLPVVLIVPQEYAYITEFELPEKASRQVLASIEYQVEDQLAQDTEVLHFAIGQQSGSRIPVLVVEQEIMMACQALQQKYSLRVVQILPEMFLCPWSNQSGEVGLLPSQSGLILRYGDYLCVKCQPEVLASFLDLINRHTRIDQINCYIEDESLLEDLDVGGFSCSIKPAKTSTLDFDSNRVINLQQRQFQASSNWTRLLQVWKGIAVAVTILLAITVFNRVAALQEMEGQLNMINARQFDLIKDHVGSQVNLNSNLKKEMIKLLQKNNSPRQNLDFLHLLVEFSQARAAFLSIQVVKIGYQQDRLSIDISSKQLNDVESLHAALNASGLTTSLEKLNIKPELVSGQFVIQGNNNG